jgi:hypothetical protein
VYSISNKVSFATINFYLPNFYYHYFINMKILLALALTLLIVIGNAAVPLGGDPCKG